MVLQTHTTLHEKLPDWPFKPCTLLESSSICSFLPWLAILLHTWLISPCFTPLVLMHYDPHWLPQPPLYTDMLNSPKHKLCVRMGFRSPSYVCSKHIKQHKHGNDPYVFKSHTLQSRDIKYTAQDEMGCSNGNANWISSTSKAEAPPHNCSAEAVRSTVPWDV